MEELLVGLILDERISGQIDQVHSRLVLDRRYEVIHIPQCVANCILDLPTHTNMRHWIHGQIMYRTCVKPSLEKRLNFSLFKTQNYFPD